MDRFADFVSSALEAYLQGAVEAGKKPHEVAVKELGAYLEFPVDSPGLPRQEAEEGPGLLLVRVEGRVEHEDLPDPRGYKGGKLGLEAAGRETALATFPPSFIAVGAAEGATPR